MSTYGVFLVRIWSEYKSANSVQIREDTDEKKLRVWTFFAQWSFYWGGFSSWKFILHIVYIFKLIWNFSTKYCHLDQRFRNVFKSVLSLFELSVHAQFSLVQISWRSDASTVVSWQFIFHEIPLSGFFMKYPNSGSIKNASCKFSRCGMLENISV